MEARGLKENYFQSKFVEQLKKNGYTVFVLSDSFTSGIPDVYCCKDGVSHWYELKVVNRSKGTVILSDGSQGYGFTKIQKVTLYKLRQAGVDAWGVVHIAPRKTTVLVPPEDFDTETSIEDLLKYVKFSP